MSEQKDLELEAIDQVNRSSLSTHITTSRGEVQQMKMYLDSVLAELLEIHRPK